MPMCMVIRGGNLWRLLSAPFKWILKARISSAQWLSRCSALLVACVSSEWTTRKMLTFHVQQEQLRSRDKSSNSLPLNSNEGKGEFQIQKDSDIGTQCLAHKGRMNFHLDCFCCHDLVVDVTVGSILHCLQTHQEETVESKQIWNSFLADHSLFWDKNHGRILENRSLIW
ncbi:uncharacterized protein M8220_005461 isoform 3-T8 [Acridotheres tristis]